MIEEKVGKTDFTVKRSSGSILTKSRQLKSRLRASEAEEENPIDIFSRTISDFQLKPFEDVQGYLDSLEENKKPRPTSRATGLGATAISEGDTWEKITENNLKKFEGFKKKAYWDVDHYRVGYGTDTLYDKDGKEIKVTKNTVVNQEDALRSLRYRITKDFLPIIKNTIGSSWDDLSNNAKAATLSITYNYGRVPNRIRDALKSGDNNEIAKAIRSLSADNKGINKKRRYTEAELVLLPDTSQTSLVQRRTK